MKLSTMDSGEESDLESLVTQAKESGIWGEVEKRMWDDNDWHQTLKTQLEEKLAMQKELQQQSLQAQKYEKRLLYNRTNSHPHVANLNHTKATITRVEYDYDDDIRVPYDAHYKRPQNTSVHSETDVQRFIYNILEAICGKVSNCISLCENRRICGVECDILLMYGDNCIPFAAIEIKKNGGPEFVKAIFVDGDGVDPKLKGKVQGEHLNQLRQILLFGFQKVFGVISDGNHSMITCTHAFSKQEDLPDDTKQSSNKHIAQAMEYAKSPGNRIDLTTNTTNRKSLVNRIWPPMQQLYCSDYSDAEAEDPMPKRGNWERTLKLLTHFVWLAVNSVDPRQFRREVVLKTNIPARIIQMSGESMLAHTTIKFDTEPELWKCLLASNKVKNIYLFKHLGMGVNGDCCLATTESKQSFCAVKFFADRKSALQDALNECERWNSINVELPKSRVVSLPPASEYGDEITQDACLCMPYLEAIVSKADRTNALKRGYIKACLERFAAKGFLHEEVRWRHLGCFRVDPSNPASSMVFLCDLGNLRERREEESDHEWGQATTLWMKESIAKLQETACER